MRAQLRSWRWTLATTEKLSSLASLGLAAVALFSASFALRVLAVSLAVVMTVLGLWAQGKRSKSSKLQLAERQELDALRRQLANSVMFALTAIGKSSCPLGDWRVSLLRQGLDADNNVIFTRLARVAKIPELSDGGRVVFKKNHSVLRGIEYLEVNDPAAPPVEERYGFPDPNRDKGAWLDAHEKIVGSDAQFLRMLSRSYAWRRFHLEGSGFGYFVLLVECTHPSGVEGDVLRSSMVGGLGVAIVRALEAEALPRYSSAARVD